jgi:F-box domain
MSCSCCSHEHKANIFEPFVDRFALLTRCRLDNGPKRFKKPSIGPESNEWNGSKLQSLPIELYQASLSYLDLATLTAMRRVSQYTRHAIDILYQYQELYEHAPQALRACLSTGVASHIPLRRLHHSLTSIECHYCKPLHYHSPDSKCNYCKLTYVHLPIPVLLTESKPALGPNPRSAVISLSTKATAAASSVYATTPPLSLSS